MSTSDQPHIPEGAHSSTHADPDNTEQFLRGAEHRAEKIRRYLATVTGTTNINVLLTTKIPTADVRPHPNAPGYLVRITAAALPQPATDLDREVFDRAAQHGLALHEAGHILYTDFDALFSALENAVTNNTPAIQEFAKEIFNTFEDGAVEQNIREDFSEVAAKRLELVNRNLRQERLNSVPPTERRNMTASNAIQTAALDTCVADSGITERLCNDGKDEWDFANDDHRRLYFALLPIIRETHLKTITAPDAETRAQHIAQCWTVIETTLFDTDKPQQAGAESDAPQNSDQSEGQSTPDDSSDPDAAADNSQSQSPDSNTDSPAHSESPTAEDSSPTDDTDADLNAPPEKTPNTGNGNVGDSDADTEADDVATTQLSPHEAAPDSAFTSPLDNPLDEDEPFSNPSVDTRDDLSESPSCSEESISDHQDDVFGDDTSPDHADDQNDTDNADQDTLSTASDEDGTEPTIGAETERTDADTITDDDNQTTVGPPDSEGEHENEPDEVTTKDEESTPQDTNQSSLADFTSPESEQDGDTEEDTSEEASQPEATSGDSADSEPSETSSEEDATPSTDNSPESSTAGDTTTTPTPSDVSIPDEELAEKEREKLTSERRKADAKASRQQQANDFAEAALNDTDVDAEIAPENQAHFDAPRWATTSAKARPLAQTFKYRLKDANKDNKKRGTTAGTPDSSLLYNTSTGNPNYMAQRTRGDSKRHSFVIILDRSSSMSFHTSNKSPVENAEEGVVQAALALEECDVDICIIDFYHGDVRILNPFHQPVEEAKHRLLTGESGGGTPLGKALAVAKTQLDAVGGPGHVLAMTDDDPTDEERYHAEATNCQYPIHGGLIDMGNNSTVTERDAKRLYDTHVTVSSATDLSTKLIHLAKRLTLS
jgi:Mg-chelatase subunit ChlD